MKIAMIGQKGIPATYGGIERHVEEISKRLVARGHEVTVYCRFHYTPEGGTHKGVRLVRLPSWNTKHLDTATHEWALREAGFSGIQWHAAKLSPAEADGPNREFWRDFFPDPPVILLECRKPLA